MTCDATQERLRAISEALCTLYAQVGELSVVKSRNKIVAFHNAPGTLRDRESIAEWQVLDVSDDLTRKQAEIRALAEERDMLRFEWQYLRGGDDGE